MLERAVLIRSTDRQDVKKGIENARKLLTRSDFQVGAESDVLPNFYDVADLGVV